MHARVRASLRGSRPLRGGGRLWAHAMCVCVWPCRADDGHVAAARSLPAQETFRDASAFNQPLDSWDTSRVTELGVSARSAVPPALAARAGAHARAHACVRWCASRRGSHAAAWWRRLCGCMGGVCVFGDAVLTMGARVAAARSPRAVHLLCRLRLQPASGQLEHVADDESTGKRTLGSAARARGACGCTRTCTCMRAVVCAAARLARC